MSPRIESRVVSFFVLISCVVAVCTVGIDRARAEMVAPYPMCGVDTRLTRCIQAVFVNDQQIVPAGNYGGGISWFQGPTSTPPSPLQFPSRFIVSASENWQGVAFSLGGFWADNSHVIAGVNPAWKVRLVINFGQTPLSYAFISGRLEGYQLRTESDGSQVVDITGFPAAQNWYDRLGNYDATAQKRRPIARDVVLRECAQPEQRATASRPPAFGGFVQTVNTMNGTPRSDPSIIRRAAMSGMAIAANYGCGDLPIPQWQPTTKSLAVEIVAPHFTTTGEVNTGYFHAVLPASYIINVLGISIDEAVSGGVSLAMNNLAVSQSPDTTAVKLLPDGSLSIRFEGFHYSKRKLVLKPSLTTRSTRSVGGGGVRLNSSSLARGGMVEIGFTFTKTLSGNVHAFLLDHRKTLQYLGMTSTANGVGSLTTVIPNSIVTGRGEILLSRYDSKTARRTLLRRPISVTK
jgi:hypothetical protein